MNMRVVECDLFKPQFVAFKRCRQCSSVYEVFSNFNALDFELCPECNERMKRGAP
jgi:predicted nucleic acid-binding Zn ribbon protein